MTIQKADELHYLEAFLNKVGVVGTPTSLPDGSGPDFLVVGSGFRFGVEITEFWREAPGNGPARRQVEGTRDQLLRAGEALCGSSGIPPLEVHVHFSEEAMLAKSRIPALAAELLKAIRRDQPGPGEHRNIGWEDGPSEGLPPEVVGITVIAREASSNHRWVVVDADYVRPVSADHLWVRIAAKNEKAAGYFAVVPEVWLLVIFDSRRMSGTFDLNSNAFEGNYESKFSRTFVFDMFSGIARELVTHYPPNAV